MAPHRILVTGGTRSGKSRYAEGLLAGQPRVTYVAPGPPADPAADAEWASRIAEHQVRRPPTWATIEDSDLAAVLRRETGALLIDSLGTWVATTVDGLGAEAGQDLWTQPVREWQAPFDTRLSAVLDAWSETPGMVVAVTNEVGWGLVAEHRSGRVFVDLLGRVNAEVAARCDEVVLVVAGRALHL